MKALQHAQVAARRFGGRWQDWYDFHDWFDQSKMAFPSMQHRMFLHSDFGAGVATRLFGEILTAADGTRIASIELAEAHLVEDLGRVVKLSEWLEEMDYTSLLQAQTRALRQRSRAEETLVTSPLEEFTQRYGGNTLDYAPLVSFFEEPALYTQSDPRSLWVLHNSFGTYLAEQLFGKVITLSSGRLMPTRQLAEDLVKARLGFIPSAAAIASRVRLRNWMVGSEVGAALKSRKYKQQNLPASVLD
jgi:hypothetical protein